ncbi:MAG: UDP-N-acetylmuramate dehydrogenase [Bacteroides sp.]|nr:UDP-N-acetylmuramate dehydrogenase [Bacteroides sp.]
MNNYSLLNHNTFGIDVKAAVFWEYSSEEELCTLIAGGFVTSPYLHIGRGSNLLFLGDYKGTVLHSSIGGIEVMFEDEKQVEVRVGAGMVWDDFVAYCVSRNWHGAENLSLIPGEVGAAAVQNIGAYGVEIKDLITAVETLNIEGKPRVYTAEECNYAYRYSLFKQPEMKSVFVTRVHLRLSKQENYKLDYGSIRQELDRYEKPSLKLVRQVIMDIRCSKLPDPKELGNAGSFFMNPVIAREQYEALLQTYPTMPHYKIDDGHVKVPAGWLIEQSGWKGKALGRAAVHDKQALVLVNLGGATGRDVLALSNAICCSVQQQFGIEIHPEVNFI